MRTRTWIVLLAFSLIATPSFSQDKKREWQTGKLISIEKGEQLGGIYSPPNQSFGTIIRYPVWIYAVETETLRYEFSFRGRHPRPLTVNNEVKFAVEPKGHAFLIDENGKEFKVSVVKTAAKQAAH